MRELGRVKELCVQVGRVEAFWPRACASRSIGAAGRDEGGDVGDRVVDEEDVAAPLEVQRLVEILRVGRVDSDEWDRRFRPPRVGVERLDCFAPRRQGRLGGSRARRPAPAGRAKAAASQARQPGRPRMRRGTAGGPVVAPAQGTRQDSGMVLLERDELLDELETLRAEGGARLRRRRGGRGKTRSSAPSRTVGEVQRGSCENLAAPTPLGPFSTSGSSAESRARSPPRSARRRARARGRPLGGRGVARRPARPRPQDRRDGCVRGRDVPRRRGGGRPPIARRPRGARVGLGGRPAVGAAPLLEQSASWPSHPTRTGTRSTG